MPNTDQPAEDLHEPREWLRVTLSSIGDAVITTDINGEVTFLNPVAQELTGWTQEDVAGVPLETVFQIVNEDTRAKVENPAARALREGVIVGLANHTLLISKDGTEHPIDDSAAPIRNAQGDIAGVVLVFRDVTERRAYEHSLRDALNYAESILATVRESLIVLDKTLRVKSANRCFYETFKVSPEETENQFIYELGDGQWNIPKLRELLEDLLPQNHHFDDFEIEHNFPTVGRKIMRLNARRIFKEGNHMETILLAIEDITERRLTEINLEDSETRYRRLFETAQDAILILHGGSGKIMDANPYIKDLLGYSQAELVGKQLWEIGLFKDISENRAAFRQLQEDGYVRYEHLPLKTKVGNPIEVEFVSNTYKVDHHEVIQCNIRDITERARLERQTHEQAAELADLHSRKDEFLAMLSHELRNPLSAIFNAMHIIRLQAVDENPIQQKARNVLERQVGQMSRLVNDLMEVSRVITGRVRLEEERLDLRGVAEHAIAAARPLIDKRRQQLSVSLGDEPVWLNADAARLEQVFVNLLNNAAKYTEEDGKIWLTVQTEGSEAVMRVRDTGDGIAHELLPKIFDLFTQADRTLDRAQGGLGIGLSLVKRLIELHHGSVAAQSAGLGQGSEFIVRLPIADSESAETDNNPKSQIENSNSLKILVVDDNADSADMLAITLQMLGYEVRALYSGQKVLEMANAFQPDIVILDIGMPEMNGYEVAVALRQNPPTKNVWLIALTGYGQEAKRKRTQESGFDHHLVKPLQPEKLEELLTTLSKQPRSSK